MNALWRCQTTIILRYMWVTLHSYACIPIRSCTRTCKSRSEDDRSYLHQLAHSGFSAHRHEKQREILDWKRTVIQKIGVCHREIWKKKNKQILRLFVSLTILLLLVDIALACAVCAIRDPAQFEWWMNNEARRERIEEETAWYRTTYEYYIVCVLCFVFCVLCFVFCVWWYSTQ